MWRARVIVGRKTATAYRARKDEATQAETELRERLKRQSQAAVNVPYARKKRRIFDKLLLDVFGAMRLDEIGPRAIDKYRTGRSQRSGPSGSTRPWPCSCTRCARQTWEVIASAPRIKPLRLPPVEFDHLDDDEADRLAVAAERDAAPWSAMVLTALRTGLRLGELRGLRWRDVDLVAGRIVVRVAADELADLHPPKSGRHREIPLGDDVVAVLQAHRHLRTHVFDNED